MTTRVIPTTVPPKLPRTDVVPSVSGKQPPIGAVAGHIPDEFCHWFVATTRTLCGVTCPPVLGLHKQPPCPNGCTPCPFCTEGYVREYGDDS